MTNGTTFKKITNNDIYNKLVFIETIARRNQTHIKIIWSVLFLLFGAVLAHVVGG